MKVTIVGGERMLIDKCIVVEGRADKLRVAEVLAEQVIILCTNGTIAEHSLLDLLEPYEHLHMYTMFDRDKSGEKLRSLMRRTYSDATQIVIPKPYIEVEGTPYTVLAQLLRNEKFKVHEQFLKLG